MIQSLKRLVDYFKYITAWSTVNYNSLGLAFSSMQNEFYQSFHLIITQIIMRALIFLCIEPLNFPTNF